MSVLILILKILGYALLALLALLLLVLVLPLHCYVMYKGGVLYLDLRVLGIKIKLMPRKKKKQSAKKEKLQDKEEPSDYLFEDTLPSEIADTTPADTDELSAQTEDKETAQTAEQPTEQSQPQTEDMEEEKEEKNKKSDSETLSQKFEQIRGYIPIFQKALGGLGKSIKLWDVTMVVNVRSDDAARIGIKSGIWWMLFTEIMQTLAALFGSSVKYGEVTVMPCFEGISGAEERFGCKLRVIPAIILFVAARFLLQFFIYKKKQGGTAEKE